MENILEFLKEKKIACGFISLFLLMSTFFTLYVREVTAEETYTCPVMETTIEEEEEVIIDIKGAITNPGVYRVKQGSIIQEVITIAGGLTSDADTKNLNLSKKVSNEMVITVFTKEEVKKIEEEQLPIKEKDDLTLEKNELISINTATEEELSTLPGIGEAKAKIIISYRENCGKFKKKEDLKNIKGIGDKIYEKLASYITV